MKYKNYKRNHAVVHGSEKALHKFLNATLLIDGEHKKHKLQYSRLPNSEDALTWSCFDVLRKYKPENLAEALNEMLEDSFDGRMPFDFQNEQHITVEIGKEYIAPTLANEKNEKESTEVDASIETDDKLVFIEAKLYSHISLSDETRPYNQIARKLRIGLDCARNENKQFYFIFLDLAPLTHFNIDKPKTEAEKSTYFEDKWISAWWFNHYKNGTSIEPLAAILGDVTTNEEELKQVQENMGWLTWACLFKTILRAIIK